MPSDAALVLTERYRSSDLGGLLLPADGYHPFPTADQRELWESLPADLRQAAVAAGEQHLGLQWPTLPATLYLDFSRTGNRAGYEEPYFARRHILAGLVIAECVQAEGRFLDDILNGIWAICEESTWCIPAHDGRGGLPDTGSHIIDLFAAETADLLAWAHYLLRARLDGVSDRVCERIRCEVKTRLLDPFLARSDFGWMGIEWHGRLNNWSPWICSNCLAASLLLETDGDRRAEVVAKAMRILDRFLAGYHSDGGCDEGPSYWTVAGASLFDCLELLRGASRGNIDVYDEPLIQEMGRYIYRVHISGDYFVNFADSPAKVSIPAGLVHRYGRRIEDPDMGALASAVYHRVGARALLGGSLLRVLPDLFDCEGIAAQAQPPHLRDVWLDGTQIMAARERGGSDRGLYLAAKGGHNDESHNHNDVGQFIVYSDGQPVVIDVGVGTYTAKTFSDQRYEIWTMQSGCHNLPTVNGIQQQAGEEFRAADVSYRADDGLAEFTLDIAAAYPKAAGIRSWRRTCRLIRSREARVEIEDDFALETPSQEVALPIMTACRPEIEGPGAIRLAAQTHELRLTFAPAALDPAVEPITLDDQRLRASWGERVFRIMLTPKAAVGRGTWRLSLTRA